MLANIEKLEGFDDFEVLRNTIMKEWQEKSKVKMAEDIELSIK